MSTSAAETYTYVYRSRWCGAWLLHNDIDVIPTVSWSTWAGITRRRASIRELRSQTLSGEVGTWAVEVAAGAVAAA